MIDFMQRNILDGLPEPRRGHFNMLWDGSGASNGQRLQERIAINKMILLQTCNIEIQYLSFLGAVNI